MAAVKVRAIQPGDVEWLAQNLRQADRDELAAGGHEPDEFEAVLRFSVEGSTFCFAVLEGDALVCLWGCGPAADHPSAGVPWMLGTERTYKLGKALFIIAQTTFDRVRMTYPLMFNYVHAGNVKSVRWLRRLGWRVEPAAPHGPKGELFHRFERAA